MPRKKGKRRRRKPKRKPKTLADVVGLTIDASNILIGTSASLAVASQVSKAIKK